MLKPGRPSKQSAKDKAIASVQEVEVPTVKTKRFNADIPEELHRDMKIQAAKEGVKLNSLTEKIFKEYLSKNS